MQSLTRDEFLEVLGLTSGAFDQLQHAGHVALAFGTPLPATPGRILDRNCPGWRPGSGQAEGFRQGCRIAGQTNVIRYPRQRKQKHHVINTQQSISISRNRQPDNARGEGKPSPVRSPHEAKRNAGFTRTGDDDPDCAALHPGYAC